MSSTDRPMPSMSRLYKSVAFALCASSLHPFSAAIAQQSEQEEAQAIEEVVATGTRLKGTAAAVLQERQNQAFVADIMGAEQISRTGDGDAASALRRVTGLTLVDGKFIYVRGLGERYSSTQLNGMGVPSPDPTRSVVPLDLFPSDIIESLNVQKSFSPNMPSHFGGGNVNIRTKTIPTDFIFRLSGGLGYNTNNSDDGFFYSGGGDDWTGRDDGTRELSSVISDSLDRAQSDAGIQGSNSYRLTLEDRKAMLSSMFWDIGPDPKSVDPDFNLGMTLGDNYDTDYGVFGFLSAVSYENEWNINQGSQGNNLGTVGCSDLPDRYSKDGKCFAQFFEGVDTEQQVRWSGMLNLGWEINSNHRIDMTNLILHDMSDRVRVREFIDINETVFGETELQRVDMLFEERRMNSNQIKGTHNFPELNFLYLDWYAGTSRARRSAPGSLDVTYQQNFAEGAFVDQQLQPIAATSVNRGYQDLRDVVETWGWNAGYPIMAEGLELEIKAGADFFEKARKAENIPINVTHRAISSDFLFGNRIDEIFSDENINNDDFYRSATGANILESGMADGDEFAAGTKIDAYYLMMDAFIDNTWRVSGGVRYEDFRQVSVPFEAHSNQFSVSPEEIEQLFFEEDDFFPSLALTYMMDNDMQFRLNMSQTTIRPDLRDVSVTFFIDPLTEFLVRGTPLLQSSKLDNVDFRWEWYREAGNNLSVAVFYKDIEKPIELIELNTVGGAAPNLLTANGESGKLYGLEVEFLQDLSIISSELSNFFVTGNLTISDSEVTLGAVEDDVTSLFETQLLDALNATSASITVTNNKRRLVGHSEWVANLQVGYDSDNGEHSATLVYNAFGPRIIVPGTRGNEDAEEQTYHSLDMNYTYYPDFNTRIKFSIKNLLDQSKQIQQEGLNLLLQEDGVEFGLSYSYQF